MMDSNLLCVGPLLHRRSSSVLIAQRSGEGRVERSSIKVCSVLSCQIQSPQCAVAAFLEYFEEYLWAGWMVLTHFLCAFLAAPFRNEAERLLTSHV